MHNLSSASHTGNYGGGGGGFLCTAVSEPTDAVSWRISWRTIEESRRDGAACGSRLVSAGVFGLCATGGW